MTDTSTDLVARLDCRAIFSDCGQYRYFLRRNHSPLISSRPLLWNMLNPSNAGHENNDPTTTIGIGFGQAWGFGIHAAVNAFGLVDTDPKGLLNHPDPVGPENDAYIRAALEWCDALDGQVILAWGRGASLSGRADKMLKLLGNRTVWRLGVNNDGSPRFPRAIPKTAQPQEWRLSA